MVRVNVGAVIDNGCMLFDGVSLRLGFSVDVNIKAVIVNQVTIGGQFSHPLSRGVVISLSA